MSDNLEKEYIEQQQKIQILERENEFLSLKAQENQLLSKAFEEIYKHEDSHSIYTDILEHISILLDIEYSGVFELKDDQLKILKSYSQIDHEESLKETVVISDKLKEVILKKDSYLINTKKDCKPFKEIIGFLSKEILIIKIEDQLVANLYFIFAIKSDSEPIQQHTQVLKKIADITSVKLEKIYFREKLRKTNAELEQRVEDRTKELTKLNEELHRNLEYINNINTELEESKEKAERSDRLKTEFINNMSHEVRTPLNGILGFTNLLNQEGLSDNQKSEYLSIIQSSGKQLLRIIEDILEISRLGTKQSQVRKEQFNLDEFLNELYSVFKLDVEKMPVDIKVVNYIGNDNFIYTDKNKLQRILYNLVENAIKFTQSGEIEIGLQKVKPPNLEINANINEDLLQFYVKDTGVGIKPENLNRIFERFVQEGQGLSKTAGGLGLGLSIANENALLLDGSIDVKSEKGKGSTFYLNIPCHLVKQEHSETFDEELKAKLLENNYSILIVEDEFINYKYLQELIVRLDNKIHISYAKNGKEAVELCQQMDFDLILMDIKMPLLNGLDATKKIKALKPYLTIIAQTAYATPDEIAAAKESGCDDYLTKPIEEKRFYTMLKKHI